MTSDCDTSVSYLKSVLSSAPVVTMPDYTLPFKVYTDASMEAVGAVLAQDKEGLERVVVYASQSLTNTQNCSVGSASVHTLHWVIFIYCDY